MGLANKFVGPDVILGDSKGMAISNEYWSQAIIKIDSLGEEYCYIPDSVFLYGEDRVPSKILAPVYIGRYPVSKAQFKHFVQETSYDYDAFDIMDQLSPKPNCPATPISWQNAKAYARWLRTLTGEYYSLPSEEEWEMTARSTDGRLYPWGNNIPKDGQKNFLLNQHHTMTDESGINPLNMSPFGCFDLVGNVWEWCLDEVDEHGEAHIMRGGSCVNDESYCNCYARCYDSPSDKRILFAGFRLVYLPEDMYMIYKAAIEKNSSATSVY